MPKYIVSIPEIHLVNVEVEAQTSNEAMEKAGKEYYADTTLYMDELEFSHTEDEDMWDAHLVR